ncbi:PRKC apoptosis WT1 regulator protein-like isoform X3 [Formica exsecta]|nr:PRKC apoptosis WT1 regulator protein-like isoform X3 [Formica exsecta]XP_029675258.1 PRKC apoptosis WT1 regulator protein-like isoform X3 [Formica exsecta]XP_029675259.1 PRKC apoptosis WT1 regulator protein-like isoform X3 [Formica exsecta]XP_029675260.1 PRKC apoptosis WT1 regulator protein-like isoform X3 [Formica exsecta]XP_029675261.1 PRKC apoptosis WT1 regulator protein-like isoform X3 [Formica exsecta]XP_029675263.1 PRKC apoptosis WT1 regulator protein-like isoform X3 [Formica exsecta]
MASSSVSQEDFDNDFELTSRRSRIRTARARVGPPRTGDVSSISFQKSTPDMEESQGAYDTSSNPMLLSEHDNLQTKPIIRKQDKRVTGRVFSVVSCLHRPTHINKGKQQRDRRKLREKRRSTGVVHLPSTESTGGSTGEDEEELTGTCLETKHNTHHNEFLDHELIEDRTARMYTQRRNKRHYRTSYRSCIIRHNCHSDLEADDEEFDSLNQSDSINQSDHGNHEPQTSVNATGRPRLPTPTGDNPHELIERAQEENRRLLSLLEDRDHKIMALEARLLKQQHEMAVERERLREENATLIRAMAALASN